MLTERGRVVALEGDVAWVETLRSSACGQCAARAGCGHDLVNRASAGASRALVRARRAPEFHGHLAIYDSVTLALPERNFLAAASLLYAGPIGLALAGAFCADRLIAGNSLAPGASDLAVALGAVAGLAVGLLGVRLLAGRAGSRVHFEPQITARE